ncbi:MAG: hypothetical protein ACRDRW_06590 [Pseudonocardiaceae bacterium]
MIEAPGMPNHEGVLFSALQYQLAHLSILDYLAGPAGLVACRRAQCGH